MVKLQDVEVVLQSPQRIIDKSLTAANAGNEWKVQMRDDVVGAERFEESKRRNGVVAPGPGVVMGQSSSSSSGDLRGAEVPTSRGSRSTAQDAGLPRLQDLPESRPVWSAHGEMMRLGELRC